MEWTLKLGEPVGCGQLKYFLCDLRDLGVSLLIFRVFSRVSRATQMTWYRGGIDSRRSTGLDNFHISFVTLFLTFATSVRIPPSFGRRTAISPFGRLSWPQDNFAARPSTLGKLMRLPYLRKR